jgi:hypothetical protein
MYDTNKLSWKKRHEGWALYCEGRSGAILHVVPDQTYPKMWRIRCPDGSLSDMANLTWARDGALTIALRILDARSDRSKRGGYTDRRGTVEATKAKSRPRGHRVPNKGAAA